jgi:lipopolysaccharide export LptBFGC system permease protein LptF
MVPKTLIRYFLKRWGLHILAGFVFFGGLLLAWEVKSISRIIFEQQASIYNLIPLLLTTIPWNVGLILPMAAVLGGLLGTQYLSEGSEFVALQGLGCGKLGFLIPWGILSAILITFSVINAHWLSPWASRMEGRLLYELAQETALAGGYMPKIGEGPKLIRGNAPASASTSPSPGHAIYCGISKIDSSLHIMQIGSDDVSHLIGDRYTYNIEKVKTGEDDPFERMQVSFRFEDVSGRSVARASDFSGLNGQIRDLSFKTLEINQPIQIEKQSVYKPTAMRHLGTGEVLAAAKSGAPQLRRMAGVELSRRFSNPLVCCALLLLGISIGLSHPRFYKGGAFVKSIVVIFLYFVCVKVVEGWIESNRIDWTYISILLPFLFFSAGWLLLNKKMYPAMHGQRKLTGGLSKFFKKFRPRGFADGVKRAVHAVWPLNIIGKGSGKRRDEVGSGIIGRWTARKWWSNFLGVLSIFVVFHIFMEFAGLAQHVATGNARFWLFIKYWACNLPVTLPFVLPSVFLMAWVLTFSDASISREWVALRAGGVSLIQWARGSWKAWGLAIIAAFAIEAYFSPLAYASQDYYYRQLKGAEAATAKRSDFSAVDDTPATLFLGATGIFWHSEGQARWGFPQLPRSGAPSLIFWEHGQPATRQLNWDGGEWGPGPEAGTFFPASSLMRYQKTDEIPTLDLFTWQAWAPSAERGTLLWGRLLKWMAGPCLFFAALGFAFPAPRKGRGQVLGNALILSLLFMWMQNLFEGASKAGQIPPLWGIFAPLLMLAGFGLANIRRLRT